MRALFRATCAICVVASPVDTIAGAIGSYRAAQFPSGHPEIVRPFGRNGVDFFSGAVQVRENMNSSLFEVRIVQNKSDTQSAVARSLYYEIGRSGDEVAVATCEFIVTSVQKHISGTALTMLTFGGDLPDGTHITGDLSDETAKLGSGRPIRNLTTKKGSTLGARSYTLSWDEKHASWNPQIEKFILFNFHGTGYLFRKTCGAKPEASRSVRDYSAVMESIFQYDQAE